MARHRAAVPERVPHGAPTRGHMLAAAGVLVTAALVSIPSVAHAASHTVRPRPNEGIMSMVFRTCGSVASWKANAANNGVRPAAYIIYRGKSYKIDCSARRGRPGAGNPAPVRGGWSKPLPGKRCISGWGAARSHGPHQGVDLSAGSGTPIYAAGSGRVHSVKYQGGGAGHYIVLSHGSGQFTVYMHLRSRSPLGVGQRVTAGRTVVGRVGATGDATGPHLHFEAHRGLWHAVNPVNFMRSKGVRICG
jgi:murein DD-endopeptidase MepM/ murein hydrolase activator NlpD